MANKPNNPALWSRAKSLARQKFDVYPSAYANGWAAKWYKGKGGSWRKAEYGMQVMGDGGIPDNEGFNALPERVQQMIISRMEQGGEKMPPEIARARFAAAGNLNQMADYGYAYGGYIPEMMYGGYDHMAEGGEPQNAGFQALPDRVQEQIMANMAYGGYIPEMAYGGYYEDPQEMKGGGYVVTRSSDRKGKTHKVTGPDGTVKYFGDSKLGQHPKDPDRKAAFYARHKKNLDGNPYFRAFARATWEDGGEIPDMQNGGYVGHDGKRHMSSTPTWSGYAGYEDGGELPQAGDGWMVPAAIGALALGTSLWANNKRKQIGQAIMPMLTGAGGGMMEDGGELPLAEFGITSPFFFNNLSQFIGSQPDPNQPPGIKYNPKKEAYNMNMIGNGMMSVAQPAGTQLTGATGSNPFAWQSFSQTAAPVNPNQPKQFEQQQAVNPIYGDVSNLQKTLREGSGKEIRSSVKDFNQTYGSNMKVPFGTFGSKGRETMDKVGKVSQGIQNVIGAGSVVTDLINNRKIKKENEQRQVMSGMTDSLNMVAPEDRGDWVAAGSRIGEIRPDQYVVNKGMYTGQFYPTMNMMQTGGVIDSEIDMPVTELMKMPTRIPEPGGFSAERIPVGNPAMKLNLDSNFEDYAIKAEKYIRSVNPNTNITGEMLAVGAQMAFEKHGKIVPVELALAQLQQEGYLAKGSKPNKPQRTRNPFNVGNTDDGSVVNYADLQGGVNAYFDLVAGQYLKKRTPDQLLENYVNTSGNRYASDKRYEDSLKKIVSQVQNRVFEEGGVYDLSEDEIRSILSSGGNVEFV